VLPALLVGLHLQQQHLEDRLRPELCLPLTLQSVQSHCGGAPMKGGPQVLWHIGWPSPTLKPVQWTSVFYVCIYFSPLCCCSYKMCWECTVCHRIVGDAWRGISEQMMRYMNYFSVQLTLHWTSAFICISVTYRFLYSSPKHECIFLYFFLFFNWLCMRYVLQIFKSVH